MRDFKVLGIIAGAHSCGAAYVINGEAVAVIEEERVNRVKCFEDYENNFERYPYDSVQCLINRHGLVLSEIDFFTSFLPYEYTRDFMLQISGHLIPEDKFYRVDHHEAHAYLSYLMSGFEEDTMVFCADASGANNYNSKTYIGTKGRLYFQHGITNERKSLGHFYAALTELVGFKRLKDEGKIVGLSGHGQFWPDLYNAWEDVLRIEGVRTDYDNHPVESGGIYSALYTKFFEFVGSKYWKNKAAIEDIACTGQILFENRVLELIQNNRNTMPVGIKKLALSGGIFANVKLNKRINELPWVDELFVLPPMGDEGLALGCAMATHGRFVADVRPFKQTVYLGNSYSNEEILAEYMACERPLERSDVDLDIICRLLSDKKIIGLYQGKSEHGPRALGNRSIICDCTHPETYSILNNKLQRNDYMPFAPAVLDEDCDKIFNISKSKYAAEFMTLLVDTREEYHDKIPTVVHPKDKTARIQIVSEKANPLFYSILKKYKEMSGDGILVNTSFNVHNEPIVDSPADAFKHLQNGTIDALVTPAGIFY